LNVGLQMVRDGVAWYDQSDTVPDGDARRLFEQSELAARRAQGSLAGCGSHSAVGVAGAGGGEIRGLCGRRLRLRRLFDEPGRGRARARLHSE
jgi:hypothetical protein